MTEVEELTFETLRTICSTIVVATSEPRNEVKLQRLELNVHQWDVCDYPIFTWLESILVNLGVPQSFINGGECDMVENLSRMLCDSILQRDDTHMDYFCIFVMVLDCRCCYNIVNTMCFFCNELVPSSEFVQKMACGGGEHSLPAGATTLGRFKVKDGEEEKDTCVICLEEFSDDAARLPCSHVCHYDCILKWFVKSSTCPMCRFQCSRVPFYHHDQ